MSSGGLAAPSLPPTPEDPPPIRGTRLPRPFLRSLRTLFEILDDQQSGTIHVSEIESRWGRGGSGVTAQGDRERCQLPAGVLQALQQVAEPCGGYLSFPRLVAGLRIALLRAEEEEEAEKAREGAGAGQAEGGQSSSQSMKNLSRIRESDGKGVSRSRSINSSLCQAGRRRNIRILKEPRRHTISNAMEYDTLKQMQELERQRDVLLQGLEMVDQVRDWFQRHLLEAQRRQTHMGAEATCFPDPYANQSCLLLAKIQEVNLCLKNLLTSPGKTEVPLGGFGVPLYSPGKKEFHQQAVTVLKEQNHLLIKEVSEKSDRIAQLEQEKAALCKQLKESRGYRLPSHKESTFI
ncbi:Suppressor APC domain-containing protein 2 [Varanus komodoensis]|uniref:suppressor APC domain-containing protein 1 n=1 Tax=Varanus komodoensis TaxID=61221 RepID=UPI001CF7940B|nr:suppressor APC domain-containing protein 1 [Varanus komodoensis]KAF7236198.1 Suppressor APC domain-containing protein 2 [Varanus komodoensis]